MDSITPAGDVEVLPAIPDPRSPRVEDRGIAKMTYLGGVRYDFQWDDDAPKSSCWFCPASKKDEIIWLGRHHPRLLERALAVEANAQPNLTSVKGLGRSFAWSDFLDATDGRPLFGPCS